MLIGSGGVAVLVALGLAYLLTPSQPRKHR